MTILSTLSDASHASFTEQLIALPFRPLPIFLTWPNSAPHLPACWWKPMR